jgi:hypothetical protein
MQKLKLKSINKFCKSCSSSHKKHSKIGFAIFGFSYDFIWILQGAVKTLKRGKIIFTHRPLERFKLHNHTLGLHKTPQQEFKPHNAALGPWGRCGRPDSGEDSSGDGLRRVGEESTVHKGSIWVLVRGGRPWAAAGAGAPASSKWS